MDHCSENIDLAADIIMAREDGSIKQLLAEFIIRCRQAEKPYDVEILIDAGLTPFELLANVDNLFVNLGLPVGHHHHMADNKSGDATVMRSSSSDLPDTRKVEPDKAPPRHREAGEPVSRPIQIAATG